MSDNIHISGPVAFVSSAGAAVFFSQSSSKSGAYSSNPGGTAPMVKKLQNTLKIAYWGEDNRFPQNIEQMMAYCNVGKAALGWKARALYGGGIIPVTIEGYDEKGQEIIKPADKSRFKEAYAFIRQRSFYRFMLEYLQDWSWFSNCFPEMIFNDDCSKIVNIVHQESCDCRFEQMNESGEIEHVFISKMWGMAKDQYAQFIPTKKMKGLIENPNEITEADGKYVIKLPCINAYDALGSARRIADELKKSNKALKSAILPTNYPSVNKTYYQVPEWDGARLSGWMEIASKIPSLLKAIYNKAFRIKYHLEIPETFFEKKYGAEKWADMTDDEVNQARRSLLEDMDEFLSGTENAFNSLCTFFDVSPHDKQEYGRVKITAIDDKTNIDKELITSSAADLQILIGMNVHPTLFGAGTIGTGQQRSGGSDIREAFLVYNSLLKLERNVLLEPLYLVRDFNKWPEELEFRFSDTILTTLDTGAGTKKVIS